MNNFIFSILFIGLLIIMIFSKKRRWKVGLVVSVLTVSALLVMGFRITAGSALPMGSEVIRTIDTDYGKAILYEDSSDTTFGLAEVNRTLGLLYYYGGGTNSYSVEDGVPFQAAGFGNEESFMVGVRTNDPSIKYIVIGSHLEDLQEMENEDFSMDNVKKYPDSYIIQEVEEQYVFLVLDEYSHSTWTIRALDENEKLIGEKLYGDGDARYVEESEAQAP
ncbi:hypothetical protein AB685_17140 [Bacillus sp. LL01]|uniref:hypothetical protein n=1 Tax=Bacillus sp. LL01 TaxID=1665556 RepID=UPI00064D5C1D|nr:hypothetical protein [Bacillus sp. LL01]KMJ57140.1 hypothetical protein AB685_17140 [Bacillus sp. LL01]